MKISGYCLLLVSTAVGFLRAAEPIDNWIEYPLPSGASAPVSITFGNGTFVAVGLDGTIITSTNGSDWVKANSPTTEPIGRVRFMNNHFITLQPCMVSTNGLDWSLVVMPQDPAFPIPQAPRGQFTDIAYADGTYFALGAAVLGGQANFATSTNLIDWIYRGPNFAYTIAAGNGALVSCLSPVLQDFYYAQVSTLSWQKITGLRALYQPSEITFQNGQFFAIRAGQVWTFPSPTSAFDAYILSFSPDGLNWEAAFALPGPRSFQPRRPAAGAGFYVFPAGASMYYGTALTPITSGMGSWTKVDLNLTSPTTTYSDVAFGNNVFVAATFGKIFRSGQLSGVEPLRFAKQPTSLSLTVGGKTTLSAQVQGTDPITFQWRRNGTNLIGQTFSTLTLSNVTAEIAGNYDVQATNPSGTITSDPATVTVNFTQMLLYAGVTIYGNIGDRFLVEYQDSLNASSSWTSLSTVTLASPTYVYIDYESRTQTNRYYRATFLNP
jgi:hypothetical protein